MIFRLLLACFALEKEKDLDEGSRERAAGVKGMGWMAVKGVWVDVVYQDRVLQKVFKKFMNVFRWWTRNPCRALVGKCAVSYFHIDRKSGVVPGVEAPGSYLKTPSSFLFAPSTVGVIQVLAGFLPEVKVV